MYFKIKKMVIMKVLFFICFAIFCNIHSAPDEVTVEEDEHSTRLNYFCQCFKKGMIEAEEAYKPSEKAENDTKDIVAGSFKGTANIIGVAGTPYGSTIKPVATEILSIAELIYKSVIKAREEKKISGHESIQKAFGHMINVEIDEKMTKEEKEAIAEMNNVREKIREDFEQLPFRVADVYHDMICALLYPRDAQHLGNYMGKLMIEYIINPETGMMKTPTKVQSFFENVYPNQRQDKLANMEEDEFTLYIFNWYFQQELILSFDFNQRFFDRRPARMNSHRSVKKYYSRKTVKMKYWFEVQDDEVSQGERTTNFSKQKVSLRQLLSRTPISFNTQTYRSGYGANVSKRHKHDHATKDITLRLSNGGSKLITRDYHSMILSMKNFLENSFEPQPYRLVSIPINPINNFLNIMRSELHAECDRPNFLGIKKGKNKKKGFMRFEKYTTGRPEVEVEPIKIIFKVPKVPKKFIITEL